jgi:hypothetical protein
VSWHMTFNRDIFNKFHEKYVGMQVELGDDVAYIVTRINISFWMPAGNVLELHDFLFVHGLMKNLFFVSTIMDLKRLVEFNDQQYTIRHCNQEHGRFLAKRVREIDLYMLLADTLKHEALVHESGKLSEPFCCGGKCIAGMVRRCDRV